MRYIKNILLSDEEVLLEAKVHPAILLPGLLYILLAALFIHYQPYIGESFWILKIFRFIESWVPFLPIYSAFKTYGLSDTKLIALFLLIFGIIKFAKASIIIIFTEMVITEYRVITKTGVTTTTCIEIDRSRIAGVIVFQTFTGRLLGFGEIYIQGFSGSIVDMPYITNPYKIQRHLNQNRYDHR
jgi:hypothetical protein